MTTLRELRGEAAKGLETLVLSEAGSVNFMLSIEALLISCVNSITSYTRLNFGLNLHDTSQKTHIPANNIVLENFHSHTQDFINANLLLQLNTSFGTICNMFRKPHKCDNHLLVLKP